MAFRQRESQSQVLFCNFNLLQYNFNFSDMKGVSHIEETVTETATWPKWSTAAEVGTAVDDCFSPPYHDDHVPSGTSRAKAGTAVVFLQILLVASCDMVVAGSAGPNAAGIMPKVHDM